MRSLGLLLPYGESMALALVVVTFGRCRIALVFPRILFVDMLKLSSSINAGADDDETAPDEFSFFVVIILFFSKQSIQLGSLLLSNEKLRSSYF